MFAKFCAALLIALAPSPFTAPFSTWDVSPGRQTVPTSHALPLRVPMERDQFASHGAVSLPETIAHCDTAPTMHLIVRGMPHLDRSSSTSGRAASGGMNLPDRYLLLPRILRL